jgi:hypothetical protein
VGGRKQDEFVFSVPQVIRLILESPSYLVEMSLAQSRRPIIEFQGFGVSCNQTTFAVYEKRNNLK